VIDLKKWVIPMIISTLLSLSIIAISVLYGDGKVTVGIIMGLIALILNAVVISRGFKLGFLKQNTRIMSSF